MLPQVPHLDILAFSWSDAQVLHSELVLTVDSFSPVDDEGYDVTTSHLGSVDRWKAPESVPSITSEPASSLGRVRVLVHSNQVSVHEDFYRFLSSSGDITSDNQRRFGKCPHCEMSLFLLYGQTAISYFQHVGVIPASRSCSLEVLLAFKEVVLDGCPVIEDILCCSPRVTDIWCPSPGFLFTPVAK